MKGLIAAIALTAGVVALQAIDYSDYEAATNTHGEKLSAEIAAYGVLSDAQVVLDEAQAQYDAALASYEAAKSETDVALDALNTAHEAVRGEENVGGILPVVR